jgi:catalase (peroxidase I)
VLCAAAYFWASRLSEHAATLEKDGRKPAGYWHASEFSPYSSADLVQFAGLVSVAELNGTNLTGAFKWGRSDYPWIWCQGEILQSMPDHSGGHKAGWHKHGAGMVAERLRTTFETQKEYFEDNLGLKPEEWVALLGAHSVGRAAGVRSDHHKAGSLPFDPTPTLFDNEYYKSLALASDSALLSLCPQARRPGDAHWFGPPRGATKDYTVLLDTDVAMTVEGKYLDYVKEYAMDEDAFKCQFSIALLKVRTCMHQSPSCVGQWLPHLQTAFSLNKNVKRGELLAHRGT